MRGLSDTSPEAERVLAAALRVMSPARKWEILAGTQRIAPTLHQAGVLMRRPNSTPREVRDSWRLAMLGAGLWVGFGDQGTGGLPTNPLDAIREVVSTLATLGIAHAVSGSIASSIHGNPRFTRDADLVVDPFPGAEARLVTCLGATFYVRLDAVKRAVSDRSSFNIIKPSSAFKIDVFLRQERPFERSLFARRVPSPVLGSDEPPLDVVSAEDITLLKLERFRLLGEASDQQWFDALGVLRVQADRLDSAYLNHWAAELKVADLLARARDDAAS